MTRVLPQAPGALYIESGEECFLSFLMFVRCGRPASSRSGSAAYGGLMTIADWAPRHVRPYVEAVIAAVQADPRVVGLTAGGSAATGTMDEFSDLDLVVVCRDEHHPELLRDAPAFAAGLGRCWPASPASTSASRASSSLCTGRRPCTSI